MKYFKLILIASVFMAAVISTASTALAEVKLVRAEGLFIRGEEDALAKRGALEDALKKTVSQLMEGFYASAEVVEDSSFEELDRKVMADPLKYVLNYKILASGWITHFEMPEAFDDASIMDEEAADANREAVDTPADESAIDDEARPVVLARTGVEFYHLWVEASVDADALRDEVFKLSSRGIEDSTEIEIFVLDVTDHSVLKALKDKLDKIDIVKTISYGSFSKGVATFTAEVAGTGHSLFERLGSELTGDFVLIPGGVERVIIKAVGEGS